MPNKTPAPKPKGPRTLKELRFYYEASQMTLEFSAAQIDKLHTRCAYYEHAFAYLQKARVSCADEEVERLNYVLNYIRLPLKIDPSIENSDSKLMLPALNAALKRLGAL